MEEKSGIIRIGAPGARVRVLLPGVGERDMYELADALGKRNAADVRTFSDGDGGANGEWDSEEENGAKPGVPSSLRDLLLIGFPVENWNAALSPWTAPPVFGNEPFGGCAGETMARITAFLKEDRKEFAGLSAPEYLIAGYSLAGLFSLWAVSVSGAFSGAAAVSPSVWFPGWLDWSASHPPRCPFVYLSLGDKEEKAKKPVLAAVGDAIRKEQTLLDGAGVENVLDWNPGNHFSDPAGRLAKGIAQMIGKTKQCAGSGENDVCR